MTTMGNSCDMVADNPGCGLISVGNSKGRPMIRYCVTWDRDYVEKYWLSSKAKRQLFFITTGSESTHNIRVVSLFYDPLPYLFSIMLTEGCVLTLHWLQTVPALYSECMIKL
jgi:hypothetical protein